MDPTKVVELRARRAPAQVREGVFSINHCYQVEEEMTKLRKLQPMTYPSAGSQVAFARVATALAVVSVGAFAVGALSVGALAIRTLRLKEGRVERLSIEELDVGRLRVRELITDQR